MTKKSNIKPLFDYVLVRPMESEQTTPSGIILPDSVKEKPQIGEIMVVKVGDKILYKKWGGNEVKVSSEEWLLIEQKDIMAVVS